MGKINIGRIIVGGLAAGIVGNILGYLVDGLILAPQWAGAMRTLGRPDFSVSQIVAFNVLGLVYGILVVWLYAVIRPRFGPGPRTAVYAGLLAWALGTFLPNLSLMGITGLFPSNLTAMTTAAAIVESIVAALAGCALYREVAASPLSRSAKA